MALRELLKSPTDPEFQVHVSALLVVLLLFEDLSLTVLLSLLHICHSSAIPTDL